MSVQPDFRPLIKEICRPIVEGLVLENQKTLGSPGRPLNRWDAAFWTWYAMSCDFESFWAERAKEFSDCPEDAKRIVRDVIGALLLEIAMTPH